MVIFNSYVKLPEGNSGFRCDWFVMGQLLKITVARVYADDIYRKTW